MRDDLDRLTLAEYSIDQSNGAFVAMDDLGNRDSVILRDDSSVNYTVDANTNRYTEIGGSTPEYAERPLGRNAYGNCQIMDASYNPRSSSLYANPYYFTGRRLDILDGGKLKIQDNRNRYYDTYTGRWLTHDPLGYMDGMNLYEYGLGDPVTNVDIYGLTAGDN